VISELYEENCKWQNEVLSRLKIGTANADELREHLVSLKQRQVGPALVKARYECLSEHYHKKMPIAGI